MSLVIVHEVWVGNIMTPVSCSFCRSFMMRFPKHGSFPKLLEKKAAPSRLTVFPWALVVRSGQTTSSCQTLFVEESRMLRCYIEGGNPTLPWLGFI